uniref:Odorant receptor n=1 Tax=Colaphellus bowringi TaxID=561076 RepID=A0A0S3J454_9CUCU|nr:odorant receptor OR13 [Colaphellus bowringi]
MDYGYPKNFFEANDVVKRISGIMLLQGKEDNIFFKWYQIIYIIFVYSSTVVFTVGQYIMTKNSVNKISNLVSSLGVLLTTHVGHFKFWLLLSKKKELENLKNDIEGENYQYATIGNSNPGLLLTNEKKFCTVCTYVYLAGCYLIGIFGNITTVVRLNGALTGNNTFESINMTCNDFASFTFYIPFFTANKWQCIISSTVMYSGMAFESGIHAACDLLFFAMIHCLKIQLRIIADVFRTIRRRSLLKLNVPEDYTVLHDEENSALEEELYRQLSHSTEHLNILLRVTQEIEHLFTYVLLAQTLSSLLIVASFLYLTSTISINDADFFLQMQFLLVILIQLALLCWSGNEITEGFQLIKTALYESDWLSCSHRFKRSMILTMIRLQRPVLLTLGGFSPLTLATLVGVCQGSFSYFTLFKSFQ